MYMFNDRFGSTATADHHDASDSNDFIVDAFPPKRSRALPATESGKLTTFRTILIAPEMHRTAGKPHNYAISLRSIIGAIQMEYALFSISVKLSKFN